MRKGGKKNHLFVLIMLVLAGLPVFFYGLLPYSLKLVRFRVPDPGCQPQWRIAASDSTTYPGNFIYDFEDNYNCLTLSENFAAQGKKSMVIPAGGKATGIMKLLRETGLNQLEEIRVSFQLYATAEAAGDVLYIGCALRGAKDAYNLKDVVEIKHEAHSCGSWQTVQLVFYPRNHDITAYDDILLWFSSNSRHPVYADLVRISPDPGSCRALPDPGALPPVFAETVFADTLLDKFFIKQAPLTQAIPLTHASASCILTLLSDGSAFLLRPENKKPAGILPVKFPFTPYCVLIPVNDKEKNSDALFVADTTQNRIWLCKLEEDAFRIVSEMQLSDIRKSSCPISFAAAGNGKILAVSSESVHLIAIHTDGNFAIRKISSPLLPSVHSDFLITGLSQYATADSVRLLILAHTGKNRLSAITAVIHEEKLVFRHVVKTEGYWPSGLAGYKVFPVQNGEKIFIFCPAPQPLLLLAGTSGNQFRNEAVVEFSKAAAPFPPLYCEHLSLSITTTNGNNAVFFLSSQDNADRKSNSGFSMSHTAFYKISWP